MRIVFALFLLLVMPITLAANLTLSAGECVTDANSSVIYCAPQALVPNQTLVYQQCIADTKAYFNITEFTQATSDIKQNISAITGLIGSANLSYIQSYADCSARLATTTNVVDACSAQLKNTTDANDKLTTQVSTCNYNANTTFALQQQLAQSQSNSTYWPIGAFFGGIILALWYKSSSRTKGKPMMAGTSEKAF